MVSIIVFTYKSPQIGVVTHSLYTAQKCSSLCIQLLYQSTIQLMPRDGMSYDRLLVYSKWGKNEICNKLLAWGVSICYKLWFAICLFFNGAVGPMEVTINSFLNLNLYLYPWTSFPIVWFILTGQLGAPTQGIEISWRVHSRWGRSKWWAWTWRGSISGQRKKMNF